MAAKRGRPSGLVINPAVVSWYFREHPGETRLALAERSGVSPPHFTEMVRQSKGATRSVADRICASMGLPIGVVFPELGGFRKTVTFEPLAEDLEEAVA